MSDAQIKKILLVFAHPDDEAFCCGGTIAKYNSLGCQIELVCATRGDKGVKGDPSLWQAHGLSQTRTQELERSSHILGVNKIHMLDYGDGALEQSTGVVEKIAKLIDAFRPQCVITFGSDGLSGHADHKAISRFTTQAVEKSATETSLFYVMMPMDMIRIFGWSDPSPMPVPTHNIAVDQYTSEKAQAIEAHQTQAKMRSRVDNLTPIHRKRMFGWEYFTQVVPAPAADSMSDDLFTLV